MRSTIGAIALCLAIGAAASAKADVIKTVDPGASWIGYMNVFDLPTTPGATLGAYMWGSSWGTADLCATFSGPVLTLTPNTIGDASSYWYTPAGGPGATGNKIMDASMYQQDDTLAGQTVTFTGTVLTNDLASDYSVVAFIKDFDAGYAVVGSSTSPLTPGQTFSISLATTAGDHIQFGFEMIGRDVWITDVATKGSVQVTAVPEPTFALIALASTGLLAMRRRQHA